MGNSVLDRLAHHAPVMRTVSLPRGRHRLHAMPTSTGYEIRTSSSYDWNGRRRGETPFTVLSGTQTLAKGPGQVIDLMEILKQSLSETKKGKSSQASPEAEEWTEPFTGRAGLRL